MKYSEWKPLLPFQNCYNSRWSKKCRKSKSMTKNTTTNLQAKSSRKIIFSYFCCIFEHKRVSTIKPLFFLACFHLTAHSSSSPVWCAAETVSRSKIWLYHQISIPASTCSIAWYWFLTLVQEAWNWSLQWISPCSVFICQENIHALLSRVGSACLSVGLSVHSCVMFVSLKPLKWLL